MEIEAGDQEDLADSVILVHESGMMQHVLSADRHVRFLSSLRKGKKSSVRNAIKVKRDFRANSIFLIFFG